MGEASAKSLRGGKMDDVIFAGTSGRPPLGRAEVLLTIDNADGALPIEYAEVTISRTMFRSGGSEYAINGSPCRLLDVQELLSDSGIGREMHVIVGQGQLDTILHATPEDRRGFIEEAAGVLKHRKRKEKALRKLDSTEGNLTRLNDLLTEIRRQLKPLGRQAEVARRAAGVQADVRDARARLMADDLVRARTALEQEMADETILVERRAEVEAAIEKARQAEAALEAALREDLPALSAGPGDLVRPVRPPRAAPRHPVAGRRAGPQRRHRRGPDRHRSRPRPARGRGHPGPRAGAGDRRRGRPGSAEALEAAVAARKAAEDAAAAEERRIAGLQRAAADRREGLARLHGQVNALKSRAAAADDEVGRLGHAREEAVARAERAQRDFTSLETRVAGLDAGEEGLDAEHEAAESLLGDIEDRLAKARAEVQQADRERASLLARKDALEMGLNRKDGAGALLAASDSVSGPPRLRGRAAHRPARLRGRPRGRPRLRRRRRRRPRRRRRRARHRPPQGRRPRPRRHAARRRPHRRPRLARPARPRDVRHRRRGLPGRPARGAGPTALQGGGGRRPRGRARPGRASCPTSPR